MRYINEQKYFDEFAENFTREADLHRYFRSSFKNNFRYKMDNKYRISYKIAL